jgi:predicted nucleotidyltransferase
VTNPREVDAELLHNLIDALPAQARGDAKHALEMLLLQEETRPPPTLEQLRERKPEILEIARRHGVCNIRVFGSVARGDSDGKSDADFLVDLEHGRDIADLRCFLRELRDLLGEKVDVASTGGMLSSLMRVFNEAVPL